MKLTSPAFKPNGQIPKQFTCQGANISPPLNISEIPKIAQSLALIMHDPDAPNGSFIHWLMWNISATTTIIKEGAAPAGANQGLNDFKVVGYGGPCPPSGTHRYVFTLYALGRQLALPQGATAPDLQSRLQNNTIEIAQLLGQAAA